jgi:hypothetical protein
VLATPPAQLPQLAMERNIPQTYGDDCGATPAATRTAAAARPASRTTPRR